MGNDVHKIIDSANLEAADIHKWVGDWTHLLSDPIGGVTSLVNDFIAMVTQLISVVTSFSGLSTDFVQFIVMAPYNIVMKLMVILGLKKADAPTPKAAPKKAAPKKAPQPVPAPAAKEV